MEERGERRQVRVARLPVATAPVAVLDGCGSAPEPRTEGGIAELSMLAPGTVVEIEGEVSNLSDLFCPCFVITAEGLRQWCGTT